jgi:hypothetical protein
VVEPATKGDLRPCARSATFARASVILGTVIVTAVVRLSTGQSVPRRRLIISSIVYGVWFAALYTAIGFGIGDGIVDLIR